MSGTEQHPLLGLLARHAASKHSCSVFFYKFTSIKADALMQAMRSALFCDPSPRTMPTLYVKETWSLMGCDSASKNAQAFNEKPIVEAEET